MAGGRPVSRVLLALLVLGGCAASAPRHLGAQEPAPTAADAPAAAPVATVAPLPSDGEMERFLKDAKILGTKDTGKGVTGSTRANLSDGTLTHDAHIQTIDEYKREFRTTTGVEFDFRDSWRFNIAAYRIDRLIGLNMVPVSVERHHRSAPGAFTWWVDDVLIDEGARLKKKIEAPDQRQYATQTVMMRLFDELISNTDRNQGNIIYSKDWRLWLIDHTRAFRKNPTLKKPGHITRCDRQVFERLKALDKDTLKRAVGKYLDEGQIKAVLARRDLIVQRLESFGPSSLFDRDPKSSTRPAN